MKEETNLSVDIVKPVFVYVESSVVHAFLVVYECNLLNGELKISEEHTDFKWATREEILKLEVEPFLKEFLLQLKV